jgi:hypothetical protein
MKILLAAAVLTAVTFSATGCGGNGGDEADATASKAISESLLAEQKTQGSPASLFSFDEKDADCIGDGLVDEVGREKLQEYGVLTEDNKPKGKVTEVKMSTTDAKAATDVLFGCAEVEAMVEKAIASSAAVAPTMRSCVNKAVNDANRRATFTKFFEGEPYAARQNLLQPITKCATGSGG